VLACTLQTLGLANCNFVFLDEFSGIALPHWQITVKTAARLAGESDETKTR
jgi:hypothetical protein